MYNPDQDLPDCMMPDGGEACGSYARLYAAFKEQALKLEAQQKAGAMLAESAADASRRLAAVREWLKESPTSERISMRRCNELLGLVGYPDGTGEIVFDKFDEVRWG